MDDGFREMDTAELVMELMKTGYLDAVALEVQAADGTVIAKDVMRFKVERGTDFDRSGGYAWTQIVARLDSLNG